MALPTVQHGPSPRAWGERIAQHRRIPKSRTIPTRVGRTLRAADMANRAQDHPHARGENVASIPTSVFVPRTIPTRVGRTPSSQTRCDSVADHPHARGENSSSRLRIQIKCGPSPRAWGEPVLPEEAPDAVRTIPTRVGRTLTSSTKRFRSADHPHARGENVICHELWAFYNGPSPRAWGERGGRGWASR